MIFVVINFLFNGFLLGVIYEIGYSVTHSSDKFHHPTEWICWVSGFITAGILTGIGVSTLGHHLLRFFIGARKPIGRERQKIEPLAREVLEKANDVKWTKYKLEELNFLVRDVKEPNAQALGRDTILLTDGLLRSATDEELKAVIAHELGHIHYKDSVTLIAIVFGSFATRVCMWLYSIYAVIASIVNRVFGGRGSGGFLAIGISIIPLLLFLPVVVLNWVGVRVLNLTLLFMGRKYEYRADKFAKELGYELGLIAFLERVHAITEYDNSLLSVIFNTHPAPMKRIGQLEEN